MKPIKIGLYSGGVLTVEPDGRLDVSEVMLIDLAHGLSLVSRFGGQTHELYSVGEHSIILADWLWSRGFPRVVCAGALLHDGPECLGVGDVQRFVKRRFAADLRNFDHMATLALWERLYPRDVAWESIEEAVHQHDRLLGTFEARWFQFPYDPADLPPRNVLLPFAPKCLCSWRVEREWMKSWEKYVL